MPRYTIDLLKAHVRSLGYVQYTGIQHDPNKMLHIKGIYVSFVCAHLDYFCKNYGYTLRRAEPGQKAKIFAPFRDEWLPVALREIRAEDTGKPVSQIEETTYKYKKNQLLSTKQGCIQGVSSRCIKICLRFAQIVPFATPVDRSYPRDSTWHRACGERSKH